MEGILTFVNEAVNQIQKLFDDFRPDVKTTFDEIETKVKNTMLEIGRRTVEMVISNLGTGYAGKEIKTKMLHTKRTENEL